MMRVAFIVAASLGCFSQARADTPLFAAMPVPVARPTWPLVAGVALVALLLGILIGWRLLDRRIRKKYGGLKIY